EFAILEPAGLNMTAGFERIDAATRTGALEGMVAGELIRSEVEVRTGRCESFAEAAQAMGHRRADVMGAAGRPGYRVCRGRAPPVVARPTHRPSAPTQTFSPFFPRCGIPDRFAGCDDYARFVRFLIDTRSIREHTEIWWSVRPHQAFPTVEVRICDAQPEFERAVALAGLMTALSAHYARAFDEGRPLPAHPDRMLAANLWRA